MSPQEFWLLVDEKAQDQAVGAGGLTRREISELQDMLEAPDPAEGAARA